MIRDDIQLGLSDPWWRINNLYWILDKRSLPVPFVPNVEQKEFYNLLHNRNVILKARQLGFSTLMQMLALDQCMFNDNFTANVIADTLPNAKKLFRKVAFAYERLPTLIKKSRPLVKETEEEFIWANGSSFSVGVSARGGTVQLLHVSEMGKIAKKYPEKAREIVTGAFESVPTDGILTVESTAEGNGGEFFDLCDSALKKLAAKEKLTPLDFRIHFFPWYCRDEYKLDPDGVVIPSEFARYFRDLQAKEGIKLDAAQKAWYVKKAETLKRDMKREYPSTPKEAFEVAVEGAVYGDEMTTLRERGRITSLAIDPFEPVNTFWDLGSNDHTAIWFHQKNGAWDDFIWYVQGTGKGLRHWWRVLEDWKREHGVERWGRHYLPHDAASERQGEEIETAEDILTALGMTDIEIVPRVRQIGIGIAKTRDEMVKAVRIDRDHCAEGIKCLDSYQYEWDDKRGQWRDKPLHNWASNGSDAFRQWAQGFTPATPATADGGSLNDDDSDWRLM